MESLPFARLLAWDAAVRDPEEPPQPPAAPADPDLEGWPDSEGSPHPELCRCPDCAADSSPILDD